MIIQKEDGNVSNRLQIKKADTFKKRLVGLMFQKAPIQDECLHIIPCNSIHMFFMRFPIDVIFLTKKGKVIKTIESLPPWSFVPKVKGAYSTLECPIGTIRAYAIKEGGYLDLEKGINTDSSDNQ